jgi:hypothetical protein
VYRKRSKLASKHIMDNKLRPLLLLGEITGCLVDLLDGLLIYFLIGW